MSSQPLVEGLHSLIDLGIVTVCVVQLFPGTILQFLMQDLNELMYPSGNAPPSPAASSPQTSANVRRMTTDNVRRPGPSQGSAAFNLEEPILPTQRMVNAGPRR